MDESGWLADASRNTTLPKRRMNPDHGRSRNWTSLSMQRWMNLDRGCSRNRMSLPWQRPADRMQLGIQTLFWFGHGCSGHPMHLDLDVTMVWAWMLWSSDALDKGFGRHLEHQTNPWPKD